jgi:ABC-type multidrug transport system fused ATPase/permease subunit
MQLETSFISILRTKEFRERFQQYRKFLRFLYPYRWQVLISLLCTTLLALLTVVNPLLAKVTIDVAFATRSLSLFLIIILIGLGVLLVTLLLQFLEGYLNARLDQKIHFDLSRYFYGHLLSMPVGFVETRHVGDIIYRATTDVRNVCTMILGTFPTFLLASLKLVFFLTITLWLNWKLALFAVASFPLLFINTFIFSEKVKEYQGHAQKAGSLLVGAVHDDTSGFKLIKAFAKVKRQRKRYVSLLGNATRFTFTTNLYKIFAGGMGGLLGSLWSLALSFYAGYMVIQGELTIGALVAIGMYLGYLQGPINAFASIYQSIMVGAVSAGRLEEYLQVPAEKAILEESPRVIRTKRDEKILAGSVAFEGIDFSYHPSQPVLCNCSFQVKPGMNVALVGPSGVGKTTVTKLLARFYDPQRGRILIDGRDLRTLSLEGYRRQLGMVPQEPMLFNGTVADNILFGSGNGLKPAQMDELVERLGMEEVLALLPQGLHTQVGPGGQFISGGQGQIVAIARSLIRDPAILILDEAVSLLDIATEELVAKMLRRLRQGRTTFVIAHKLRTVQECDSIFVFQTGQIVQAGSHKELVRQPGLYRSMYKAQFRNWSEVSPRL